MKIFFLLIALISCFFICAQEKIGEIQNDKYVITEDLFDIKTSWEDLLAKQEIKSPLKKWEILSYVNEGITSYMLIATTSDNNTRIACTLDLANEVFSVSEGKGTVTCTGCSTGCSPLKVGEAWFCSGGCGFNCTKSETVSTYEVEI